MIASTPGASTRFARRRADHESAGFRRIFGLAGAIPTVAVAIPVSTFLAALLLPLRRPPEWPPQIRALAIAGAAGTAALALSALINGTSLPINTIGQFAMCTLFLVALRIALGTVSEAAQYLFWLSVSMIGYYLIARPENTQGSFESLWKYGLAYPTAIVGLYLLALRGLPRHASVLFLMFFAALGLTLDYRSQGLVCLAAAILTWANGHSARAVRRVLIAVLGLALLAFALPAAINSGLFGDGVRARTAAQSQFNGPMLLAGRTEPPLSAAAISAKPLLGWGNAQAIDAPTVSDGVRLAQTLGMGGPEHYVPFWVRAGGRISLHSIALGGWAEGGVIAAMFPLLLIVLFAVALLRSRGQFVALVALVCAQGIWDLAFSPWSDNKSVVLSAYAFAAALSIRASRHATDRELGNVPAVQDSDQVRRAKDYLRPTRRTNV